ncbi:hypothetical protein KIW84_046391 [Lathyrus oleraceus]|uniref:3-hydroxyisobutyryl-CoA hydrolase n=1 Tax=Pisum sativum TaxID=3888 RepID=A0A9D4XLQ8_PEA|nr:hypothetical protein KIW84_046391 [Pisum sativum]
MFIMMSNLYVILNFLKGSGRAFAAGGDIVALYRFIKEGNMEACKEMARTVYSFIYLLALLNGITMGGGGGISVPGTFLVATGTTVFAIPEVLIGFHPDAAASFYLSRLPGHLEGGGELQLARFDNCSG